MCYILSLVVLGVAPAVLLIAGLVLYSAVGRLRKNMSAEVLETIQPAIDEAIGRQDMRIEKRHQRSQKTEAGPVEDWERQMSQVQAGQPYSGKLDG